MDKSWHSNPSGFNFFKMHSFLPHCISIIFVISKHSFSPHRAHSLVGKVSHNTVENAGVELSPAPCGSRLRQAPIWNKIREGLEKAMAPHSSTLAWKIPWTEEPDRLKSMGSRRVGHDWATSLSLFTFMHWRRKWQPTPVFLPGESQGQGSLVGYGVRHDWSDTAAAAILGSVNTI